MIFKLLVVDDEVTMRKGISNYMNWASIDCQVVGSASDGVEAMEFLKSQPVDIVITDIKMPAADGLEVARFVHENYPRTKVIILTGYADFEYAQTAIKYHVTSFILKPTNKKELFAVKVMGKSLDRLGNSSLESLRRLMKGADPRKDLRRAESLYNTGNLPAVFQNIFRNRSRGLILEIHVKD